MRKKKKKNPGRFVGKEAKERERGKEKGIKKKKSFPGRILLEDENMVAKRRLVGSPCQPCGELKEAAKQRL